MYTHSPGRVHQHSAIANTLGSETYMFTSHIYTSIYIYIYIYMYMYAYRYIYIYTHLDSS